MTTYEYNQKPNTVFSDDANKSVEKIKEGKLSVIVGRNNCGKSYLLKLLTKGFGLEASYLGPQRYQNFHLLSYFSPRRRKKEERYQQFVRNFDHEYQNIDNSPLNLQQAIAELPDSQRELLFEIVYKLLDTKLEIRLTDESNTMSQKYISCDGHNISYTSSGFRLITTLITSLLDTDYDTFLIDEPELGISPEAQGVLADFIFDEQARKKYFPHIKHLIMATHSTIFLDRRNISNNYSMQKDGDTIDIKQTKTFTDFNNINFFLLGNRLETLYLPSCIILTEGKCDHAYISKFLELKFPNLQLSIINANNDSRMKEIANMAGSILTDLQKSPYRTRLVAVLDKVHDSTVATSLERLGVPNDNIIVWDKNGIEYYYPEAILKDIFGGGTEITIEDDRVSMNGSTYTKWELCERVLSKIDENTEFPDELNLKLFSLVDSMGTIAD